MDDIASIFGIAFLVINAFFNLLFCAFASTWWQKTLSLLMIPVSFVAAAWISNLGRSGLGLFTCGMAMLFCNLLFENYLDNYAARLHRLGNQKKGLAVMFRPALYYTH